MFFIIAGLVVAAPVVMRVANRVIYEEVLPRRKMKKLAEECEEGPMKVVEPVCFDMVLSMEEAQKLQEIGALDIIREGSKQKNILVEAGALKSCKGCGRLHPDQS
jgi:hypothetical protein